MRLINESSFLEREGELTASQDFKTTWRENTLEQLPPPNFPPIICPSPSLSPTEGLPERHSPHFLVLKPFKLVFLESRAHLKGKLEITWWGGPPVSSPPPLSFIPF